MGAVLNSRELGDLALFRGLEPAQLNALSGLVRYKDLPTDSSVLTIGETGEAVYILLKGAVKVFIERDDADVILALCGTGELLGEISVMDGEGHSANVVTLEPCRLLSLARPAFHQILQTVPLASYNLAILLARRLRRASRQTQSLATLDIRGRVAFQLLDFAHEYGKAGANGDIMIPIQLKQTDLAALIGACRESTNKALSAYRRSGSISIDQNHRITLHNQAALAKRCR